MAILFIEKWVWSTVQLISLNQQFPGRREMRVFVNCINGNRLRFPHRKLVVISFVTSAKWVFAHNDCIIAGTRPLTEQAQRNRRKFHVSRVSHQLLCTFFTLPRCICTCARILHRVHTICIIQAPLSSNR